MSIAEKNAYLRQIPESSKYWIAVSGESAELEEMCGWMLQTGTWVPAGGIAVSGLSLMQAFVRKDSHLLYCRLDDILDQLIDMESKLS